MSRRTAASPVGLALSLVLVVFSLAFVLPSALADSRYTITDLGVVPDGVSSYAYGLNDKGDVVGESFVTGDSGGNHAFLYTGGTMWDLGTLPGGSYSAAYGINHAGQVVGESETIIDGSGYSHAFSHSGTSAMPAADDLGAFGAGSRANAINASGRVVGDNYGGNNNAFLWDGTTMQYLGTLGGASSYGKGINDSGKVVGASDDADSNEHAFLYDGTMHDLGVLSGFTNSSATGINAGGQVAGYLWNYGNTPHFERAALYSGDSWYNLGTLLGLTDSEAKGINASGQVIGYSYNYNNGDGSTGDTAFLYSGGAMVDLNSLVNGLGGWHLTDASAINDPGQIAGTGTIGGNTHAFLLNPVLDQGTGGATPELPPIALLATLPLGLAWLRRRRTR